MFGLKHKVTSEQLENQRHLRDLGRDLEAIKSHMGYIEFTPTGIVIDANELFLEVVGYERREIQGQHHRMLCDRRYAESGEYQRFWQDLAKGEPQHGTFRRFGKGGQEVWLEASYFPVMSDQNVIKVIKIASDVTRAQNELLDRNALSTALNRSLAVIEFDPTGVILTANENFLSTIGYPLKDIVGQHHRLFCFEGFYQQNPDFWSRLASGHFQSGKFERRSASGDSIWLEATYNPIYDSSGKVYKVIKFASDITDRVNAAMRAVEAASSTSEETSQITSNARTTLEGAIANSERISEQIGEAARVTDRLNDQSISISNMVTTIRSIAEQTNLLALNAAIEAARAGDQGRGFAVVADEVRQLAGRASTATKEISDVVKQNQELTAGIRAQMERISQASIEGQERITELSSSMDEVERGVTNFAAVVSQLAEQ